MRWMSDMAVRFPKGVSIKEYGRSSEDRPLLALQVMALILSTFLESNV